MKPADVTHITSHRRFHLDPRLLGRLNNPSPYWRLSASHTNAVSIFSHPLDGYVPLRHIDGAIYSYLSGDILILMQLQLFCFHVCYNRTRLIYGLGI